MQAGLLNKHGVGKTQMEVQFRLYIPVYISVGPICLTGCEFKRLP